MRMSWYIRAVLHSTFTKLISRKVFFESSVENAVAYDKLFHMVKHVNLTVVEHCELKQRIVIE